MTFDILVYTNGLENDPTTYATNSYIQSYKMIRYLSGLIQKDIQIKIATAPDFYIYEGTILNFL